MPIFNNILAGASGQATGYDIDQSLRFEDGDSPKLTRTPGSAGSLKTWTISAWVKRGNLSDGVVISAGTYSEIKFSSDTLYGNVFLNKFELLKSNDCSKSELEINFDLYLLPIKYGNWSIVAWYA